MLNSLIYDFILLLMYGFIFYFIIVFIKSIYRKQKTSEEILQKLDEITKLLKQDEFKK